MERIMKVAVLDNAISCKANNISDEITHGDKVLATIKKYSQKDFLIYTFDIFGGKHPINEIIKALLKCIFLDIDIIVMCLTINVKRHRRLIECLLCMLKMKNTIVIAADGRHNGQDYYPSNSRYTIGVGSITRPREYLDYLEDVRPEFIRVNDMYRLFSGTSMAAAKVAGKIIWANNLGKIKSICNGDKKIEYIEKSEKKYNEEIFLHCLNILRVDKNICFFEYYNSLEDIEMKILSILSFYRMENLCMQLSFSDMVSVETLSVFIGEHLDEKISLHN